MSYGYNTTGRTSSQNSIYDYPEHLNPFYEDENHKRLRFWQFGGHRAGKSKSDRRGSLVSIRDGLRDMWEFKTFRLKKKRSSSLGINKTSESPPPLRRDEFDSHYNTISNESAYRNTVSTVGCTQSYTSTPLFLRNTRYRSSLQDQSRENGIGLNRNDRYRSTIQNGFATYGGGNMVTSTPRSRYNAATTGRGMTAGVSQSSLKSTNPFGEDEMDDTVSMTDSFISTNGTVRQSLTRPRKKRRAPPPPVPVRSIHTSLEHTNDAALTTRLTIEESPPPEKSEDITKLTNLTAEIESFVRTTSNDNINGAIVEQTSQTQPTRIPNDDNNNQVAEHGITEKKEQVATTVEQPIKIHVDQLRPGDTKLTISQAVSSQHTKTVTGTPAEIPEPVEQISREQELKIIEESNQVATPQPSPRARPSPPPIPPMPAATEELDIENIALPVTPVPARRLNKNRNQNNGNGNLLRITESSDPVTTTVNEEEENMQAKAIKNVNYEFQYKVEPIKTEIDEKLISARLKISESTESTGEMNSNPNSGAERRSVRDIIASINKSQSLLKVNYDSSGGLYSAQSSDSVNRNVKEINERETEIQRLLREMDTHFSEQVEIRNPPPLTKARGSYYDNVPEGDENMDNLDDSNNLLSKSDFRSKKSPTKSLGIDQSEGANFQDCIDWNPLPKPRRSRHFPEPANQSSAGGGVLTAIDQNSNDNNRS